LHSVREYDVKPQDIKLDDLKLPPQITAFACAEDITVMLPSVGKLDCSIDPL